MRIKSGCITAMESLDEIREEASNLGMTLKVSESWFRQTLTYHFQFNDERGRVLDYWPGNGRVWSQRANLRDTARDVWEALARAAKIRGTAASFSGQNSDNPGRCVRCEEDAPKRFDGLCAYCYSRLL